MKTTMATRPEETGGGDREPTPPSGKLLVLLPGLGAVATTLIAGVELCRRGAARPIGSVVEMGRVPSRRDPSTSHALRDLVPLAALADLEFAAWDLVRRDALAAATEAGVLSPPHLEPLQGFLSGIVPMAGACPRDSLPVRPDHTIDPRRSKRQQAQALRSDIHTQVARTGAARAVCVLLISTEPRQMPAACHASLAAFERALDEDDDAITPSQLYGYACLREGVPFANGTPNLVLELPALQELAQETCTPIAGRDLKTGQTMIKTALAAALKARELGLAGWFSTNILGNADGLALQDPDARRAKRETKESVLDSILRPDLFPDLYGDYEHQVQIHYYRPRGDQKESWDNVDLHGWLGYPMQIKIDFLARDSILAAPVCLDLALFLDLAKRAGERGIQEWLSFYFKAPLVPAGSRAVHDLFAQLSLLHRRLQRLSGHAREPERGAV
jgi:myo-inositol-1-phosphate synthase